MKLLKNKTHTNLAKSLIKMNIVKQFWNRSDFKEYYDIVPELKTNTLRDLGVNSPIHAGGKSFHLSNAINSCCGEIIERICLKRKYSFNKKKNNLQLFFSNFMIKKYKLNTNKAVSCFQYKTNKKTNLPNYLVYLDSREKISTSVGAAFGKNKNDLIKNAFLELIERDALMQSWYGDLELQKVSNIPHRLLQYSKKMKIKPRWYNVPTKAKANVYICIIKNKNQKFFGSSCDENYSIACEKSLLEALQLYTSAKFIPKNLNNLESAFVTLINNFPFKISKNKKIITKNFKFEEAINEYDLYYKDITLPQFKKYGKVIRVLVPNILHLTAKKGPLAITNELLSKKSGKKNIPFV